MDLSSRTFARCLRPDSAAQAAEAVMLGGDWGLGDLGFRGEASISSRSDPASQDTETVKRRHHAERVALKEQRRQGSPM